MIPAKTTLALFLFGVFTSAAHAELKCGPNDTKDQQGGQVMCCYTETEDRNLCGSGQDGENR